MRDRSAVALLALGLLLTSCGGDEEEATELGEEATVDTTPVTMPGMGGGMGPMGGAGAGMMMSEWESHMAAMRGARGDSLGAMMGRHREMATQMMATMDSIHGGAGMPMDSAWVATRDSLRMDLDRMQTMTPEQMQSFLEAHDTRMRRMLEMHQGAAGTR